MLIALEAGSISNPECTVMAWPTLPQLCQNYMLLCVLIGKWNESAARIDGPDTRIINPRVGRFDLTQNHAEIIVVALALARDSYRWQPICHAQEPIQEPSIQSGGILGLAWSCHCVSLRKVGAGCGSAVVLVSACRLSRNWIRLVCETRMKLCLAGCREQ